MNIQRVPISKVEAWEKNPRNIKKKDFERLKKQIQQLGIYKPLVCVLENGQYITLGGNMRLRALRELQHKEVDISIVKAKSEVRKLEYALSDNDRAGEYDEQALAELVYPHIEEINLEDFKIDVGEPINLKNLIEYFGPNLDGSEDSKYKNMPDYVEWKSKKELLKEKKEIQDKFKNIKQIYCSFSGGKDSTLALYFARKIYFPKIPITAIFVDPGVEFPGLSVHAQKTAKTLDCEFQIVKSKHDFWMGTLKWGWPGMLGAWCRPKLIYQPYDNFVKKELKKQKPEEVLLIDGSRGDQAIPTSKKSKFSGFDLFPEVKAFHPVFDLKKEEIEKIFEKEDLPLWEGYSKGFRRTACWCCPSQSPRQAYALQQNYPGLADFIRYWEKVLNQKFKHFVAGKLDIQHHGQAKSFDELVASGKRLIEKERATKC